MLRRLWIASLCMFFAGSQVIIAQVTPEQVEKVKNLIQNESYSDALTEVNNLIKADAKNPELFYLKGEALFEAGNYDGARAAYEAGTKAKGRYPQNYVGLARVLIQEDKSTEADELLKDKALYYDKGRDINVKYAVASAYLEDEKFKDAEVLLMQAQDEAPKDPRSYIELGDYYWKKGVNELALDQYEKAVGLDPNFVEGYSRVGMIKVDEQKYDEGATSLNKAIELDPSFAPPYKIMGELWLKAGDYTKARDFLKQYVELAGNDLAARIQYASYMFLNNQYDEVVSELTTIEKDTVTNLMRRLLGMAYANLGQVEKGKAYMDDYFAQYPEEFHTATDYEAYGKILLAEGSREPADEYFQKAISKNPDRKEVYNELAQDYDKRGDKFKKEKDNEAALQAYQTAAYYADKNLDLTSPKSLKIYYETAKIMYSAEILDKAKEYFNEAIKLKNDYIFPYTYLLRIAYKEDQIASKANPDTVTWNLIDPSKRVIDAFGKKNPAELSKQEKSAVLNALDLMAIYSFNPSKEEGDYHCDDAMPYVDQIKNIDSEFSGNFSQFTEYCQSIQEAAQQGGNK